jgi:hypothetical protein
VTISGQCYWSMEPILAESPLAVSASRLDMTLGSLDLQRSPVFGDGFKLLLD